MKKNIGFLLWVTCLLLAVACSRVDTELADRQGKPLVVAVTASPLADSRTLVEGSVLTDGAVVGITLDDEKDYYKTECYINLPYTYDKTDDGNAWQTQTLVNLHDQKATVHAYYPYKEDVDISEIPVEVHSKTDYMYGSAPEKVSYYNPVAEISLKHVLARVRIIFDRNTYQGEGRMTEFYIQSDGFSTEAKLNGLDGQLFDWSGNDKVNTETVYDLKKGSIEMEFLVVPKGISTYMELGAEVDGYEFKATAGPLVVEQGAIYIYEVKMNGVAMNMEVIDIQPFEKEEVDIEFTKKEN